MIGYLESLARGLPPPVGPSPVLKTTEPEVVAPGQDQRGGFSSYFGGSRVFTPAGGSTGGTGCNEKIQNETIFKLSSHEGVSPSESTRPPELAGKTSLEEAQNPTRIHEASQNNLKNLPEVDEDSELGEPDLMPVLKDLPAPALPENPAHAYWVVDRVHLTVSPPATLSEMRDRHPAAGLIWPDQRHQLDVANHCSTCENRSKHGNCGVPVSAGLSGWFQIVKHPANGQGCAVFERRAVERGVHHRQKLLDRAKALSAFYGPDDVALLQSAMLDGETDFKGWESLVGDAERHVVDPVDYRALLAEAAELVGKLAVTHPEWHESAVQRLRTGALAGLPEFVEQLKQVVSPLVRA